MCIGKGGGVCDQAPKVRSSVGLQSRFFKKYINKK